MQRLLAEATADQPAVTPDLVAKLAELFGSWRQLCRAEKRTLLREFGTRIVVGREQKRSSYCGSCGSHPWTLDLCRRR